MSMYVLWFNFIHGLILLVGPLHLVISHQHVALTTSLPFIHAKSANLIQLQKKTEVKVTNVNFFSMVVGQKLEILSFFVFQQKKRPNEVFCELLDSKLAVLNSKNIHLKKKRNLAFFQRG